MSATPPIQPDLCLEINPLFRFQWEESQDAYVLLYPEGIVKLNRSAGEILLRISEGKTVGQTVAELEARYDHPGVASSVHRFLEDSYAKGWVRAKA
jgi:pyrroloquinoline quinone biosynthesis protein D